MATPCIKISALFIYSFFALFFILSCRKSKFCEDPELSIKKSEITGNQLKLNGYFFGNPQDYNGRILYEILVLYRNGVLFKGGVSEFENLNENVNDIFLNGNKMTKAKYEWGAFLLDQGKITIEHWIPFQCSYPIEKRIGEIQNDTTINFRIKTFKTRSKIEMNIIDETFHFRQFKNKPDSLNEFVD
jgi:hypothetical protein